MESYVDDQRKDTGRKNEKSCTCQSSCTYFKEYCNSTSIHGFKYLAEDRSLGERVLWIVLITSAFMGCGYLISQIYAKYVESPVIVSFATKESPIYTIPFPAVTICPTTKAKKDIFNFTDVSRKIRNKENLTISEKRYFKYMSYMCENGNQNFPNETHFTEDLYKALDEVKIPLDKLMGACNFMGTELVCKEEFAPIILDRGVCFTFNALDKYDIYDPSVMQVNDYHNMPLTEWNVEKGYGKEELFNYHPYRAFMAGADNALQILLLQNSTDIDHMCSVDNFQGYSVVLHAPYSLPQLKKQFFMVPFSRVVNAVVYPKVMSTSDKVKRYSPKARECYFTNEKKLKYFKIYSPRNCKLECLTDYTLKKCGCINFHMPRKNGTAICGNAKYSCVKEAERDLKIDQYNLQIDNDNMDFFCDCKPLCTDLTYDVEQSQSPWDVKEQFKAGGIENYDKRIRYAKLSVFFKQDSFLTSQRNELYGPTDFLANFGGLMGLFTGFSLLSAAEILYFLSVRLWCNFRLYRCATGTGV